MSDKNLFKDLNEVQRKAVTHGNGPLLIAAGAGSGKTRTLTSRLIYLLKSGIKPENIVAVTFTNKAAKEMKSRIMNNESGIMNNGMPFIGTFHSLGVQILKQEAKLVGRTRNFTIFDEDDSLSLVKKILEEMNLSKDRFNPLAVMAKISKIKNELLDAGELGSGDRYEQIILAVFQKYGELLKKSNAFDFDDLIEKVVKIFQTHPAMLEKYQNSWQQILVDEYQDVNTSQYLLIKLLAQKHKNLFVIGDDAQSIYAFRGSDFRNFLNFEKDWQNAAIIKLEENYRSTKNIIRAASELIKNNKFQKPKALWTNNQEGSPIYLTAYQNNEEEAWGIAEKISEILKNGESLKNIAILYRTNAQSRAIEQTLIQSRIPYEIFGGLKFYARKEIKDIIAGLRYAFNPNDAASIERLAKNFNRSKNAVLLENLPRLSNELSLVQLINYFLENTDYLEYLEKNFKNPEERQENIKELINFAATFQDAHEFLEQVALMSSLDGRPKLEENAIKLMTIHLAKGLEFDHIFIVGANDGLLPHERSMLKADELEEERRLMYVAMTRAKYNLHISFYDLPSRFLGELPPELIEFKQISSYGEEIKDWDDETIYIE
ncbi:MAG: UvrD-helicase domain-containing protein [Candidatus Harrisonbacteria bacterium]|nr:UvrD-helicase domain-containing protein [Candidatus Harrisonbacteria bacterium]